MERKARLRELFKKSVRRVIIMQRVSAAISCFALTRQTERELKDLMDGITDLDIDSKIVARRPSFEDQVRQIVSATRRHNSLTELRKEEENEQERPWTMQTKKSDGIVRTRLFFNPKYFSAARTEMMPTRAKYICSKEPMDRTPKDIATLRACVRSVSSFSKFSIEVQEGLCRVMRFERFERRRIIIRKGHIGTSMYFLCFGSVGVIHDTDADILFSQTDPIVLHAGASFGETALVTQMKRNATVCCMEICEFMVIDKEDFNSLGLKQIFEKEYQERRSFFTNLSTELKFPKIAIDRLANESKPEYTAPQQIVCENTQESNSVLFVQKGIVHILRKIHLNDCDSFYRHLNNKMQNLRVGAIDPQKNYEIWAQVGSLKAGNHFSYKDYNKRSFVLISKGATILRIENEKLRKMDIFKKFAHHGQIIPSDDDICDNFMQQNNWNFLKKAVLDDTVNRLPRNEKSIRSRHHLRPVSPTREGRVAFNATDKYSSKIKKVTFQNCPQRTHHKLIESIRLPLYESSTFKNFLH